MIILWYNIDSGKSSDVKKFWVRFKMDKNLERQRVNISFDEEANFEIEFENLELEILNKRFEKVGKELTKEKLLLLKLIKEENNKIYPTNGLLILLGMTENAVAMCSRFKGKNMNIFIDKKEYSGNLFTQLENIEGFIQNHTNLRGEIIGLQRIDTYEIPQVAIREALVNAFVHRDYSNLGRNIKIAIYDDRLEIVSPGGLPNGLTNEDLFSGKSEIRNRVIARVFKELSYIEQWGSGINKIKSACLEQDLEEPIIEESGDFVGVRFFRDCVLENDTIAENIGKYRKVSESIGKYRKVSESIGKTQ
ncbi:MAG: hypothetical protein JXR63_07230 [Spirochaetales bacterium]|nr:hypothetical protein [Spirochaetales bacterium]